VWVVTRECSKNDDASANPGRDLTEPNMKWPAGVSVFIYNAINTHPPEFFYIFFKNHFSKIYYGLEILHFWHPFAVGHDG
jgi:hypothetical protein